jgi:plastocyanin
MVKFLASRAACLLLVGAVSVSGAGSDDRQGSIAGTVTLGPQLAIRRVRFDLYPDPSRQPAPTGVPSITDELQNVVVYLESVPEGADPGRADDGPQEVRQEKLTFTPHVLPVVKGTTVEFPNEDTVFHNVFSLSKVASFDLGRYPTGASKSVRFTSPGAVKVFCHIHSDMSAIVLVLDNPFFASPGTDGRFTIDGIPPGQYRIVAWHERARLSSRTIHIAAGGTTEVDFEIPLTEIAGDG